MGIKGDIAQLGERLICTQKVAGSSPVVSISNKQKYSKSYYQKNKKTILERKKKRYKENEGDIKQYLKEYYMKNRDKVLARNKEYYKKNSHKWIEWREKNKEEYNKYQRNYRKENKI